MAMKKEYQTGTMLASKVEEGGLGTWLNERAKTNWTLKILEQYHSKKYGEDAFFWILEREYEDN